MNILISGGSGLIGQALSEYLHANGDEVTIISRTPKKAVESGKSQEISWDDLSGPNGFLSRKIVDVVINLAGENIGSGRWTAKRKEKILESRLFASDMLVNAIRQTANKPGLFIQSSAIGYYGTDKEQPFDETSPPGNDFLAGVAQKWESSSLVIEEMSIRRVVIRTGVVLSIQGGALPRMLLPFHFFIGGPLGTGRQWVSWIHIEDEIRAIKHVIDKKSISGAVNLTSPNPVTNAEFGRTISRVMKRPCWLPVPAFALNTVLGEMSVLVLEGQKVRPGKLEETGFKYSFPNLGEALQDLLS